MIAQAELNKRCPACLRCHATESYLCAGCGSTFRCRSQFLTAFGIWGHRTRESVLVFDSEGNGPWPELRDEVVCAPIHAAPTGIDRPRTVLAIALATTRSERQ